MFTSFIRVNVLGAFAKLQKATFSFVISVCPSSVRMEQLAPHRTMFMKFDI